MPRLIKVKCLDGKSSYIICSMYEDIIEKVSPAKWFGAYKFFQLNQVAGYEENRAKELSIVQLKDWIDQPCPDFLIGLFDADKKKEQEKLLRGNSITMENLICWMLYGGRMGGLFSQYSFDAGPPEDLQERVPLLVHVTDSDHIKTIGKTDLSDAALSHLVKTQKKVVAQLLDLPDGRWYCFYRTLQGLAGRESAKQGQHMHFISSAYEVKRDKMIEDFKKGICPTNGFHVSLLDCQEDNVSDVEIVE